MASKRIEELADHLRGTCLSLEEGCERLGFEQDDLSMDEHEELDNLVFCCAQCDWWCEISEESYDTPGHCDECAPNEEDS